MEPQDVKFYLRKRYLVTVLVFLGFVLLYVMRTNLSISIVDMTSNTYATMGNQTVIRPAEFNWSSVEKGTILSSFSWGLFASPVGALLASRLGGVTTFGAGIVLTGLLTMLTPFLLRYNLTVFLAARILEGVFESFAASSATDVFAEWALPAERTRSMSSVCIGCVVGIMSSYPICGTLAFHLNWPAIFYITGGAAVVWFIIWIALVRNSPAEDKFILTAEKEYFSRVNRSLSAGKMTYPWTQILSSRAVLVYLNDRFVEAWSLSFVMYCLPLYMKDLLDVNIQDIGLLTGIPHVCALVGLAVGSYVADDLRNRRILSHTNVHKVYLTFSQAAAVITLLTLALWTNSLVSFICLCLFRLLYTICDISYQVLPVDIGARYASFIVGCAVTIMSVAYTLNPIVMGLIVRNHSVTEWSKYFIFISVFNAWGGIIFYKYGSGDLQPWAITTNGDEKKVDPAAVE